MLFSPLPQDCGAKRTIPANSVLPIKLVFCIAGHDIRIAFVQFPSLLSLSFPAQGDVAHLRWLTK